MFGVDQTSQQFRVSRFPRFSWECQVRLSKCSAFLMVDSQIIVILISCHCYHRAFDMIIIVSFADFNSTAAPLNSMTSWLERGGVWFVIRVRQWTGIFPTVGRVGLCSWLVYRWWPSGRRNTATLCISKTGGTLNWFCRIRLKKFRSRPRWQTVFNTEILVIDFSFSQETTYRLPVCCSLLWYFDFYNMMLYLVMKI